MAKKQPVAFSVSHACYFLLEEQIILSLIHGGSHPRNGYIVSAPIAIATGKKCLTATYVLKMRKPGNTSSCWPQYLKVAFLVYWTAHELLQVTSVGCWFLLLFTWVLTSAALLFGSQESCTPLSCLCLCNCCPYQRELMSSPTLTLPWAMQLILAGQRAHDPYRGAASAGSCSLGRFGTNLLMTAGELHAQNCNHWQRSLDAYHSSLRLWHISVVHFLLISQPENAMF